MGAIVGELFTGGEGSGVFAATYEVDGALNDPDVSVNPLAALAPGALRGLFDIFGDTDAAAQTPQSFPDSRIE